MAAAAWRQVSPVELWAPTCWDPVCSAIKGSKVWPLLCPYLASASCVCSHTFITDLWARFIASMFYSWGPWGRWVSVSSLLMVTSALSDTTGVGLLVQKHTPPPPPPSYSICFPGAPWRKWEEWNLSGAGDGAEWRQPGALITWSCAEHRGKLWTRGRVHGLLLGLGSSLPTASLNWAKASLAGLLGWSEMVPVSVNCSSCNCLLDPALCLSTPTAAYLLVSLSSLSFPSFPFSGP